MGARSEWEDERIRDKRWACRKSDTVRGERH